MRRIAHRYIHLPLADVEKLLASPIHEHRFAALEILVAQYEREHSPAIFDFYLKHTRFVNNWDLVDTSAPYIVGQHLLTRPRKILYRLAKSRNLWERRIAIVSTMVFIRAGEIEDTFAIAKLLLADDHDLIHKAVGWMLREAGKQSKPALLRFLKAELRGAAPDHAALCDRAISSGTSGRRCSLACRRLVRHRIDDVIQHDADTQRRELFRIRRIVSPFPRIARVVVEPCRRWSCAPSRRRPL